MANVGAISASSNGVQGAAAAAPVEAMSPLSIQDKFVALMAFGYTCERNNTLKELCGVEDVKTAQAHHIVDYIRSVEHRGLNPFFYPRNKPEVDEHLARGEKISFRVNNQEIRGRIYDNGNKYNNPKLKFIISEEGVIYDQGYCELYCGGSPEKMNRIFDTYQKALHMQKMSFPLGKDTLSPINALFALFLYTKLFDEESPEMDILFLLKHLKTCKDIPDLPKLENFEALIQRNLTVDANGDYYIDAIEDCKLQVTISKDQTRIIAQKFDEYWGAGKLMEILNRCGRDHTMIVSNVQAFSKEEAVREVQLPRDASWCRELGLDPSNTKSLPPVIEPGAAGAAAR